MSGWPILLLLSRSWGMWQNLVRPVLHSPQTQALWAAASGTGFFGPFNIAIDASGDVWTAGLLPQVPEGIISKLDSSGAPLSPESGFTGGGLENPRPLAIDASGAFWAVNQHGSLTKLDSSGTPLSPESG